MTIRTFQPGDEEAQVTIYNEAAGKLPGFKAATVEEVRRRLRSPSFDAHLRFLAEENGQLVGYVVLNRNGRASYPWCKPGYDHVREPLFTALESAARQAGIRRLSAAYRGDWPDQAAFLEQHGFRRAREMVNFLLNVADLPTMMARAGLLQRHMRREDLPKLRQMGGTLFDGLSDADLERALFTNRWFPAEALFVLHSRVSDEPLACAALIQEVGFADPRKVDSAMPCYRLGAFGNETQDTKRIRGMFSFLVAPNQDTIFVGLELLGHITQQIADDIEVIAGQVQSDRPAPLAFYQRFFRRQGSFPVFERDLT